MGDKKLGVDSSIVNGCNTLDLSLNNETTLVVAYAKCSKTFAGKPAIYLSLAELDNP
jgi:hypothetical protein